MVERRKKKDTKPKKTGIFVLKEQLRCTWRQLVGLAVGKVVRENISTIHKQQHNLLLLYNTLKVLYILWCTHRPISTQFVAGIAALSASRRDLIQSVVFDSQGLPII